MCVVLLGVTEGQARLGVEVGKSEKVREGEEKGSGGQSGSLLRLKENGWGCMCLYLKEEVKESIS